MIAGVSTLSIVRIVAQNGRINDTKAIYGESDIINITFSRPTNKGFLPDFATKSMLDNLFTWSMPIGYDYYGEWSSRSNIAVFIRDTAGAAPPTIGSVRHSTFLLLFKHVLYIYVLFPCRTLRVRDE